MLTTTIRRKRSDAATTLRASAMRVAGRLANLDLAKLSQNLKPNGSRQESYTDPPPPLKDWPEIDCDPLLASDDEWFCMPDDGSAPAVWPINLAIAFELNGGIRLGMMKSLPTREFRGVATIFSSHMARMHSVDIDQFGGLADWGGASLARVNRRWVPARGRTQNYNYGVGNGDIGRDDQAVRIYIGTALRHRYEWSAVFSFPNGIRLRFSCSARGALELFRDRELGDGEARRKALLHWVRRHWRKPSTAADLIDVRRHLRGVTRISWRGMDVAIYPAEYEMELACGDNGAPS